ncbi:MAG TPA: DnaA regulatory inactivator Hda [Steroidobacteraceae bacterium]|nr:DnaA regulatory inactivator Hda [Steroidobacteraceae bacterium]
MLQLPLGVRLREASRFENFSPGANRAAVHAVQSLAASTGTGVVWLWGVRGSGRSHLLQAACAGAGEAGKASSYVPVADLAGLDAGVLAGLETLAVVAIDDVDTVAGRPDWERALFNLYNAATEHDTALILAASAPPAATRWGLEDLASRFAAATVFHLRPLDDEELPAALQRRAALRGLELPADSAEFLLKRLPRDMHTLCAALDALDEASLVAQRRLTIPFLKEVLQR